MLTKYYAALAVGARVRLHSKEVLPMRGRNRIPFNRHPLAMLLEAVMNSIRNGLGMRKT